MRSIDFNIFFDSIGATILLYTYMNKPTYSFIAIGTEITTGQILNRNSQLIAKKMLPLGLEAGFQIATADKRADMLNAIRFAASHSELIIISGGLGPTSDDFTREVIAEFLEQPLLWNQSSWEDLNVFLSEREIPIREMHKQECYFPTDAIIIPNTVGTAKGFLCQSKNALLAVLPGPPIEIESIWENGLETQIKQRFSNVSPLLMEKWNVLGLAESELAQILHGALTHCSFENAYRINLPYIEFKILFSQDQQSLAMIWSNQIETILKQHSLVYFKNNFDLLKNLFISAENHNFKPVTIINRSANKTIRQRFLADLPYSFFYHETLSDDGYLNPTREPNSNELVIELALDQECFNLSYQIKSADLNINETINSPLSKRSRKERLEKDLLERALIKINNQL